MKHVPAFEYSSTVNRKSSINWVCQSQFFENSLAFSIDCVSLERRELQLDVEATALSQEKDESSKQRLKQVKEELSKIRDELKPLKMRHQAG
jgi:hypothetical protein